MRYTLYFIFTPREIIFSKWLEMFTKSTMFLSVIQERLPTANGSRNFRLERHEIYQPFYH